MAWEYPAIVIDGETTMTKEQVKAEFGFSLQAQAEMRMEKNRLNPHKRIPFIKQGKRIYYLRSEIIRLLKSLENK